MNYGVKMMLLAGICYAVMNALVKYLDNIPAIEIVLFRSVITFVICIAVLKSVGVSVWGNNRTILLLRGIFGSIGIIFFFTTLHHMELATANVIHYLSPIFTTVIARIFLKERVRYVQWLFFAISFVGVAIVKGFGHVNTYYFFIGILAALSSGFAYNCIRRLKESENPYVIIFYFPLITIPVVLGYFFFNPSVWVNPVGMDWLLLLSIGLLTQFAQLFMTKAYQAEVASKVSAVTYLGIIYALAFGFFFFNEVLSFQVIIGMVVVLTGVLLNVFYKKGRLS